jgi:hypothetical protein
MQINTSGALATALISAVIGFGIAFLIERKISSQMKKKSQKILSFIAMTSFGYGLTGILNELIGFPLQGLSIRFEKLAGLVIANVLFLPLCLLAIAKLIGLKNKTASVDFGSPSSQTSGNYFKYFLLLAAAISISFVVYVAIEKDNLGATYDFYTKADYKNCNSAYESKPSFSLKFMFKKDTNEIFMTAEIEEDGVKKQQLLKLDKCNILDSKNWTCGGEWSGSYQSPKYMFIDGAFAYDKGFSTLHANCEVRFVKR